MDCRVNSADWTSLIHSVRGGGVTLSFLLKERVGCGFILPLLCDSFARLHHPVHYFTAITLFCLVSQSPGMAPQQPASSEFLQRGVPLVCEVTSSSVQRGKSRGSFISGCSRSHLCLPPKGCGIKPQVTWTRVDWSHCSDDLTEKIRLGTFLDSDTVTRMTCFESLICRWYL